MVVRKRGEGIAVGATPGGKSKLVSTPTAGPVTEFRTAEQFTPSAAPPTPEPTEVTTAQPTQKPGLWTRAVDWWNRRIDVAAGGAGLTPQEKEAIAGPGQSKYLTGMDLLWAGAAGSVGIGGFGAGGAALGAGKTATNQLYVTKSSAKVFRETGQIIQKANPIIYSLVKKFLIGAGIAATTASAAGGSIVFGKWQLNEGLDRLNYAASRADKLGTINPATGLFVGDELRAEADKLIALSQTKGMGIPIYGAAKGVAENTRAAAISNAAYKLISEHERSGVTNEEARQQEIQDQEDFIERNRVAKVEILRLEGEARARGDEQAALFWADYAEQQRKLDKEYQEWLAEFWMAYWKQKLKIQADTGRSRLGFGLLR